MGTGAMSEPDKKDESPLYLNRKAATIVVRENGKAYIRDGGDMSETQEVKRMPDMSDISKISGTDSGVKSQALGAGTNGAKDGAGNIDKIRDLIFGNQMTDYEKRFSRLEERMFKEMTDSKSESKKNIESLEKYVSKEIEMLKDRLVQEQNARNDTFKELSRQMKDINRSFEKKLDNLSEQFNENATDLRQQISDLSQSLKNEIYRRYEEMSYTIEQTAQELKAGKVDRSALSDMLSEMAIRISSDRT
ncbi:MAG: hypothetical protein HC887_08315 [Desulfobacteraceae bacterium]|nr:hypothetical protein [Desulfobacteraceae bacterium]